jgi:putative heme-binding domain-containing protein
VRVTTGPDGAIWVVDMYRAVIEHPEWIPEAWQQQVDVRAGSNRGRIYRIVPKDDSPPPRWPNLTELSIEELAALLDSKSGTLRDMAQQVLLERGDKAVAPALQMLAASSQSPEARLHALWSLDGFGELRDDDLLAALHDEHPGVLRNAILLCEPRLATSDKLLTALTRLVDHPDAKVRLQLTLTLGESEAKVAGIALRKITSSVGDDPWLAEAVVSSSKHHAIPILGQSLSALRRGSQSNDASKRLVAMIGDLIATAQKSGRNPAALVAPALLEADASAAWVFPLAAACARGVSEAENADPQVRRAVEEVYQRARKLAADEAASAALRCQALQLFATGLGRAEDEQSFLGDLLTAQTPLEVQLAAVERLAQFRDAKSTDQLLSRWPEMSVAIRDAVAHRMLATAESAEALIGRLESGDILASDLSPVVRQTLRQSGSQSLQARINRVLGKTAAANQDLIEQYLRFQREVTHSADLNRGRELFKKHCTACHVPDESGHASGPNLSNLTDRSDAGLTESILAPNRAVEPQYRSYVVVLNDGRALSGIIAAETGDALTLGLADGKRTTIHRSKIDEFRNTGVSLMPDGMHQELDPAMLRDVVEYLRSDSFLQSANTRN